MTRPQSRNTGWAHIRNAEDFERVFDVSRETLERLEIYAQCLRDWQRSINLVSSTTIDDLWHRHFADSAQVLAYATDSKSWADLGSGAGFPGMVIAILINSDSGRYMQLIESNGRKCAFLRHVARETGVAVEIIEARIETITKKPTLTPVDCVTARALAPLGKLLDYAAPLFADNTRALFLKGRDWESEIAEAGNAWSFRSRLHPSSTDREGQIVEIWEVNSINPQTRTVGR